MDSKRKSLALDSKVSKEPANLASHYGCGKIHSEGINHAVSGRCFGSDHVVRSTASQPYAAVLSLAHSGKLQGDHAIPEYLAAILEAEQCRAL